MKRGTIIIVSIASMLLLSMAPATAGGWATVRFDGELGNVVAGESHTIAFSVWAHDITPVPVDPPTLVAQHRGTEETIENRSEPTGNHGHFVVEMTFPTDGEWKLTARIAPYPDYALPTITVLPAAASQPEFKDALNIELVAGPCGGAYETASAVDLIALGTPDQRLWGQIEMSLAKLVDGPNALVLRGADTTVLSCADLESALGATRIVVSMTPLDESVESGLAVLDANGEQTSITFYPVSITSPSNVAAVDIVGGITEDWQFELPDLEVESGTKVVWRNLTEEVHSVAGSSLDFKDSGLIEPGGSFVQVVNEPGTYQYRCAPHPWMIGTLTVTE